MRHDLPPPGPTGVAGLRGRAETDRRRRSVRTMRWLLFALVLLGVLAYAADQVVTGVAERRVAAEFEQSMGGGSAVADLAGWPVSLGLLRGEVPQATINATAVPLRDIGATLPSLDVSLTDVTLPYASGNTAGLSASAGRFVARVDQTALNSIVAASGAPDGAQVQIAGDVLQIVIQGVPVDLTVSAREGALVVAPTNGLLSALSGGERVFPLNGLPPGTALDTVQVTGGSVLLSGPVDLATLVANS